MERILVVEDSKIIQKVLKHLIRTRLHFAVDMCETLAETRSLLEQPDKNYLVAVLDLTLPDAPDGEVVDYVLARNIPVIVLTATFNEQRREAILNKRVVDYIVKESRHSYEYVARLINRLDRNRRIKALVVDDSLSSRGYIRSLLVHQNFQVLEATDGEQALIMMQENPDIKLVITDYNMPGMDGFKLTTELRTQLEQDRVAIIGLSSQGSSMVSAKFIKNGANDFLAKPFSHEEFYCRVMQNIEALERIETIRDAANRDYLTSLYNRRHFYTDAGHIYTQASKTESTISLAMMDIDHFKQINDNYGHDAGDRVLVDMAHALSSHFNDALVARLGGEEFCVLFQNLSANETRPRLDDFRTDLQNSVIEIGEDLINFTVSIGVTDAPGESLEDMVKEADTLLYEAKNSGRNQVITNVD